MPELVSRLCFNRARWTLEPFALGRLEIFLLSHNHILGTLDFTGSENWAPSMHVPYSTALHVIIQKG